MSISIIAAIAAQSRGIGRDNGLPWSKPLKPDMARFVQITTGHPVIMGRTTWESIPARFRPLAGRTNIVVTRQSGVTFEGAHAAYSLSGALQRAEHFSGADEIFVIGGASLYEPALAVASRLYLTLVGEEPVSDRYFPQYDHLFSMVIEQTVVPDFSPRLTYLTLER